MTFKLTQGHQGFRKGTQVEVLCIQYREKGGPVESFYVACPDGSRMEVPVEKVHG